MKKLLVFGVIALFIGLAFIPSFNAESISMLENHPPYVPSNPYPDGPPVDIDVILSWDGGDPDIGDTVTYYVYFDWPNNPPEIIGPYPANQTRIQFEPGKLIYYKVYFWKVIALDNHGLQTEGPVWSFTTIYPNHPPEAPLIKGKVLVDGGKTYNYKFKATDPDGDDVRYYINWNDGSFEWTDYYPSGFEIIVNHTFDDTQTATIKARANDTHGALGPVGTIQWSKEDDCFECQSDDRPICDLLKRLSKTYWDKAGDFAAKSLEYQKGTFMFYIYFNLFWIYAGLAAYPVLIGELIFDCYMGP